MKTLVLLILLGVLVNAQKKPWVTSNEFDIKANEHYIIILYNQDSSKSFTLFDNILEKPQKLILIMQQDFYTDRSKYPDKIVLPYPILDSGLYYLIIKSNEKVDKRKIIFLK